MVKVVKLKVTETQIVGALLFISALFMRPTILGEVYTPVALIAAAVACILYALSRSTRLGAEALQRNTFIALLVILLWLYLIIQGMGSERLPDVIKAATSISFLMIVFGILLADAKVYRFFMILLIWSSIIQIVSYLISLVIIFSTGIDQDALIYYQIETQSYGEVGGRVMFPFSLIYGVMDFNGFLVYRLAGIFRESGILQAFIVWALLSLEDFGMDKRRNQIILLVGLVLTMSSAGVIVFSLAYLLKLYLSGKISLTQNIRKGFAIFAGVTIGALAFLYMPVFGLFEKQETRAESITDRVDATVAGVQYFLDHPLGAGMYNNPFDFAGVNFIASLSLIGVIGLVISLSIYWYATASLPTKYQKLKYIIATSPFLITGIFSQPFLDAPLVLVMLFQAYYTVSADDKAIISGPLISDKRVLAKIYRKRPQ